MAYLINTFPVKKMGAIIKLSYLLISFVFTKANKATLSRSYSNEGVTLKGYCNKAVSRSLNSVNPKSRCNILAAGYGRFRRA